MTVRCYRRITTGEPIISDGADIYLDPSGARELGEELIAAADRADRGEFDRWNAKAGRWEPAT
jgi:hypothetical protein